MYNFQSEFRPNHSTNLCLADLTGNILKKVDEGFLNGMILIDLQKAFDIINHKFCCKNWKETIWIWKDFFFFLFDLCQGHASSSKIKLALVCWWFMSMYQHKDIVKIEKIFNEDFQNTCDWFIDNKLNIYFRDDKTKSVLFASKRRAKNIRKLNIRI